MTYEQIRQIMAKLGLPNIPQANAAGWIHIACPFAQWKHTSGVDRSRGFAIKVEERGISAFTCPACKSHGRISGIARGLSVYRQHDYDEVATLADQFDLLGATVPGFDEQFAPAPEVMEPLDEALFAGIFDPVANHNEAKRYVLSRRITRPTVEKLGIEYDPDKRRITFPVRDHEGKLYGWSGRTVIPGHEPRILDYAGLPKRSLILGEERWRPGVPKLIVEGLIAYARMHEIGAEDIVDIGALLGSSLTPEKAEILKRHGCTVYPLVDPDQAGDQCLFGLWRPADIDPQTGAVLTDGYFEGGGMIDVLGDELPVALPLYPQGISDPDDLTFDQLKHMIDTAQLQGQSQRWLDKKSKPR